MNALNYSCRSEKRNVIEAINCHSGDIQQVKSGCTDTFESTDSSVIPLFFLIKLILFPIIIAGFLLFLVELEMKSISNNYLILAVFSFITSISVFNDINYYRSSRIFPIFAAFANIFARWIIVFFIVIVLCYITGLHIYYSKQVLLAWLIFTPFVLLVSQICVWLIIRHILIIRPTKNAVIIGANQLAFELHRKVNEDRFLNINVTGFFDDREIRRSSWITDEKKLGHLVDLPGYIKKNSIQIVYICLPIMWQPRIIKLLDQLHDTTASIYFVPDVFMFDLMRPRIDLISGIPAVAIRETPFCGFRELSKRTIDIIFSSMILLAIWPVMLAIGIGVKLTSPGPVIFKQRRYGLNGEEILVYKFRTMRVCEDGATITQATHNDVRITPLGRFLRRTSLDELPQFLNVLGGSMSVVGPRPHAVAHNEIYRELIKGYMLRYKVKPGITGWAQVNGFRGETATVDMMKARVDYDLYYLRNWSLSMDFWIILKTILLVFRDYKAY